MNTTYIQPEMIKMTKKSDFSDGDKLFYELGYFSRSLKTSRGYFDGWDPDSWTRTGRFVQVDDPGLFIKSDYRFDYPEFIEHHNFMIIKSK